MDSVLHTPVVQEGEQTDRIYCSQPFLLRYKITYVGTCVGIAAQSVAWKTLHTSPSLKYFDIPGAIYKIWWWQAVITFSIAFIIYLLKLMYFQKAVWRELNDPVRANFFFTLTLTLTFLTIGVPEEYEFKWGTCFLFYFCAIAELFGRLLLWRVHLEVKAFNFACGSVSDKLVRELSEPTLSHAPAESKLRKAVGSARSSEWLYGKKLSFRNINLPAMLSLIGNFVSASLGSKELIKEEVGDFAIFLFSVGIFYYFMVLVTVYRQLSVGAGEGAIWSLPQEMHPALFFLVAPPCAAAAALSDIQGNFTLSCKLLFFFGMFMYLLMARSMHLFVTTPFSLAWWAFTFPMVAAGLSAAKWSGKSSLTLLQPRCP
ncbi:hypothetical protein CYMTET_44176 [Cymbomonas tetramitiformis]|uniref:Uncharacterized protein n=1 Tax=Cymbomonas tetramitiformis TaxID=36881 RepID=A0AAE0C0S0_9CHLO|nr:hypothetical protein CYMTET_44176 [Cymbomonas tetramitiformis]